MPQITDEEAELLNITVGAILRIMANHPEPQRVAMMLMLALLHYGYTPDSKLWVIQETNAQLQPKALEIYDRMINEPVS